MQRRQEKEDKEREEKNLYQTEREKEAEERKKLFAQMTFSDNNIPARKTAAACSSGTRGGTARGWSSAVPAPSGPGVKNPSGPGPTGRIGFKVEKTPMKNGRPIGRRVQDLPAPEPTARPAKNSVATSAKPQRQGPQPTPATNKNSTPTHPLPGESTRDFQKRMTRLKYKPGQIEKFLHAYEERLEKKGEEVGRLGKKQTSADRGEEEKPSDEKLMAVASSLVWQ